MTVIKILKFCHLSSMSDLQLIQHVIDILDYSTLFIWSLCEWFLSKTENEVCESKLWPGQEKGKLCAAYYKHSFISCECAQYSWAAKKSSTWCSSFNVFLPIWCKVEVLGNACSSQIYNSGFRYLKNLSVVPKQGLEKIVGEQLTDCKIFPELHQSAINDSSLYNLGFYFYLLALVESSLEVLLMLALLSRFFLQGVSLCLVWLDEGGDEEELVLARESSSDIPVWIGEEPKPKAGIKTTKDKRSKLAPQLYEGADSQWFLTKTDANVVPTGHRSCSVSYFTSNFHYLFMFMCCNC